MTKQSFWSWLFKARELSLIVVIVALIAVTTVTQPQYLFSEGGLRDLLRTPTLYIALAVGQAIVMITRNIDLSMGSILGLTAYFCGNLFHEAPWIPIPVVILARLAVAISTQGRGIGFGMLKDAIRRALVISEQAGIRAMLTHPIDANARCFYEKFGFMPSPLREQQLLLLLKDARRLA